MGVLQEFQLPTKRRMFRQEEERSEKKVNYFRFLLGMVGIALTFFFRDQITAKQTLLQYIVSVTVSTYCLGLFMILRTGKYRSCVKYISTGFDVIVVSVVLWGPGNISWGTFKSPEFILYFVVIALAAYRFSMCPWAVEACFFVATPIRCQPGNSRINCAFGSIATDAGVTSIFSSWLFSCGVTMSHVNEASKLAIHTTSNRLIPRINHFVLPL